MRQFLNAIFWGLAGASLLTFLYFIIGSIIRWSGAQNIKFIIITYLFTTVLSVCGIALGAFFGVSAKKFTRKGERISVFISHSHIDAGKAIKIANDLRKHNIYPLVPSEFLQPGDLIAEEIREAIFKCDAVIFLIPENSQDQSFQLEEIKESVIYNRPVFPVLLRNQVIPESLREVVTISLVDNWVKGMEYLIKTIETNGKYLTSQSEMNRYAADLARIANNELFNLIKQLEETIVPERVAFLQQSQETWEKYAHAQADFSSSIALGGTMHPLLYHSKYESLIRERIICLRQDMDESNGLST